MSLFPFPFEGVSKPANLKVWPQEIQTEETDKTGRIGRLVDTINTVHTYIKSWSPSFVDHLNPSWNKTRFLKEYNLRFARQLTGLLALERMLYAEIGVQLRELFARDAAAKKLVLELKENKKVRQLLEAEKRACEIILQRTEWYYSKDGIAKMEELFAIGEVAYVRGTMQKTVPNLIREIILLIDRELALERAEYTLIHR